MIYYILWFVFIANVQSAPNRDFALIYLTRYGYFDSSAATESFVKDTAFKKAVSEFQSNVGLEVTGDLTEKTLYMMTQPRCGFKDTVGTANNYRSKRYALQGSSWRHSNIKYKVSKYPHNLPKQSIDHEVARAFSEWSKYADLDFTPSQDEADIEIKFEKYEHGDESPFDGTGGVLAHANFPVHGGGVHFDASEDWGINSTDVSKKDLYRTAAHEIGHALGLGHSDILHSLMSPFYNSTKLSSLITDDDIQAIQALYGKKSGTQLPSFNKTNPSSLLCQNTKFDTIFNNLNGDIYLFRNDSYWKISKYGDTYKEYPKRISSYWVNLPTPIDAGFFDVTGKIYFFKDSQLWRYSLNSLDIDYPKRISDAFPGVPDNIDAAFIWRGNGKLYIFKGSRFWKCNAYRKFCYGNNYPKPISNWKGIPSTLDAAFSAGYSYTYFFKDDDYYKFDNIDFSVVESDPPYPRSTTRWLLNCKK